MKKLLSTVILLGTINFLIGQNLPVNFENGLVSTSTFIDFDGGTATVLTNPNPSGINSSNKVAKIVRNGGATWSGSKIILSSNLDFSIKNIAESKSCYFNADFNRRFFSFNLFTNHKFY